MTTWNKVQDSLPEFYRECLVHPRPTDLICTAELDSKGWFYDDGGVWGYDRADLNHITHWMYLPEEPKDTPEVKTREVPELPPERVVLHSVMADERVSSLDAFYKRWE